MRFSVSPGVCGGRVIMGPGITYSLTLGFPLSSLGLAGWVGFVFFEFKFGGS